MWKRGKSDYIKDEMIWWQSSHEQSPLEREAAIGLKEMKDEVRKSMHLNVGNQQKARVCTLLPKSVCAIDDTYMVILIIFHSSCEDHNMMMSVI